MSSSSFCPAALITGGTTGIGLSTARVLRARGFDVLVTGSNPETLSAAEAALAGEVSVMRADARSLADADRVAEAVRARFGRLDLVFLNAGLGRMRPIEEVDEAAFDECFDINVKGQFFTLQRVLPLLADGSSIVFNSALGAHRGLPSWSVYSAAKGAVLSLMRSLAIELAPRGIRVNAVLPGPIDTPAWGKLGLPAEAIPSLRQGLTSRVPLGRLGEADEVARVVAFLASPAASFITGADIGVDGGMGVA